MRRGGVNGAPRRRLVWRLPAVPIRSCRKTVGAGAAGRRFRREHASRAARALCRLLRSGRARGGICDAGISDPDALPSPAFGRFPERGGWCLKIYRKTNLLLKTSSYVIRLLANLHAMLTTIISLVCLVIGLCWRSDQLNVMSFLVAEQPTSTPTKVGAIHFRKMKRIKNTMSIFMERSFWCGASSKSGVANSFHEFEDPT